MKKIVELSFIITVIMIVLVLSSCDSGEYRNTKTKQIRIKATPTISIAIDKTDRVLTEDGITVTYTATVTPSSNTAPVVWTISSGATEYVDFKPNSNTCTLTYIKEGGRNIILTATSGDKSASVNDIVTIKLIKVKIENNGKNSAVNFLLIDDKVTEVNPEKPKPFFMAETEVTQSLFNIVGMKKQNPNDFNGDNLPVGNITWYESIAFCNEATKKASFTYNSKTIKLSEKDCVYYSDSNFKKIYDIKDAKTSKEVFVKEDANGFRLPTSIQWLYAAMGGEYSTTVGKFEDSQEASKYTYAGSNNINEVAWYWETSNDRPHNVKEKKVNGYGLYDMSGNVREWCSDLFMYSPLYRWSRGGSWSFINDSCKVANKDYNAPSVPQEFRGLRLIWCLDSSLF